VVPKNENAALRRVPIFHVGVKNFVGHISGRTSALSAGGEFGSKVDEEGRKKALREIGRCPRSA